MGNRAYVTVEKNHYKTSYYLHWNGGLDTMAPVCRTLFDHDASSAQDFEKLMQACEIKIEKQPSYIPTSQTEENGHYLINLDRQTLELTKEGSSLARWIPHLKEAFEAFVNNKIKEEYRERVRSDYWGGILEIGEKTFKKAGDL